MRIFRDKYTDRSGQRVTARRWTIDFADHKQRRHRVAGFTDKRATQALAHNIEALVSCKVGGQRLDVELQRWMEGLSGALMGKLVSWGLMDGQRAEGGKLLTVHLADWKHSLVASGCSKMHIGAICPRVEKIVKACKFQTISDIDPVKIERYLVRLRDKGVVRTFKATDAQTGRPKTRTVKISKATYNDYIRAVRQFCNWLVEVGRIDKSPLQALKKVSTTKADQVRNARPLHVAEIRKLIRKTRNAPDYRGIPGPERALLYTVACETGLRANELRLLMVDDFDFNGRNLTVRPEVSKNDTEAVLPMKSTTAEMVRDHVKHKLPNSLAFSVPAQPHLMIKNDLENAKIEYETDEGTAYFHSLRHAYATALSSAAGNVKTAQSLMRHSDPRLTLNIYTHGVPEQERAAIEALPDLNVPDKQAKNGTGQ